jgi:glycerol-3-phosphate cytidylyltransferase
MAAGSNTLVLTFGTFDLFHIGHLRILERAGKLGGRLVVGVSSDDLNFRKKGRCPVINQEERLSIVKSLSFVHDAFYEESLELKRQYILDHKATHLVMGDDWKGKFDEFADICQVVYLPRTCGISTTEIIEKIANEFRKDGRS